ncbi:MAG: DUF4234 domain-containing protein [Eubacterium sp.]
MLTKRNWAMCWLLSMITGGIYTAYIVFVEICDLKAMDDDTEENYTLHLVLFCLLFVCTASIAGFIAFWIYQKKAVELGKKYNLNLKPRSGFIYALIMYVPILSYWINIKNHNALIDAYQNSLTNGNADINDEEQYVVVENN